VAPPAERPWGDCGDARGPAGSGGPSGKCKVALRIDLIYPFWPPQNIAKRRRALMVHYSAGARAGPGVVCVGRGGGL
jgi:hypothetical protein